MLDEYNEYPITEGFAGVNDESSVRTTTELYLPRRFQDFEFVCHDFKVQTLNFKKQAINIIFEIKGEQTDIYSTDEEWKYATIKNFFKGSHLEINATKLYVPLFALMLNKFMYVDSIETLSMETGEIFFDQNIDYIFDSTSSKPTKNKETNYCFYNKKTTAFYGQFSLNKKYQLKIELVSENPSLEFAFLPLFNKCIFRNILLIDESEIKVDLNFHVLSAKKSKTLDDTLDKKYTLNMEPKYPDHLKISNRFRGTMPLFYLGDDYGMPDDQESFDPQKFLYDFEKLKGMEIKQFECVRFVGLFTIPGDLVHVCVDIQRKNIPSRVFELICNSKKHEHDSFLINVDIFNLSKDKKRLLIEIEENGFVEKFRKTEFIFGLDNNRSIPARKKLEIIPKIRFGAIENLVTPTRISFTLRVSNEDTKETIYSDNLSLNFLPNDEIIWSMRDVSQSKTYDFHNYICAWVKTRDVDGSIDEIRAKSVKYSKNNSFSYDGSIESLIDIVSSIYRYLNEDLKFTYINQPISMSSVDSVQRILLPEQTIKNKAGNCIDLTVLFASILEGFGINSLIILIPGHAFIAWGNKKSIDSLMGLETTFLGRYSFEEAIKKGNEELKENVLFFGEKKIIFPDLLAKIRGVRIISLKESRDAGIYNRLFCES